VRVLMVSQPLAEGVPRHVLDLVRSLDLDRCDVDVACPRRSTLWAALEHDERVRLHEIAPGRRPSLADLSSVWRLVRLARRADVIHAHSSKGGFLARVAALLARRTEICIFTPHAWSFWAGGRLERRLYRLLERLAARWCRTIVVVSDDERIAGLAARIGKPKQYRVIPNGVEPEEFSATPDPVQGRVLMVGRLARQKRPDVAVLAFAQVLARHPSATLHLVGDGPLRSEVDALVTELGLRDSVELLGVRRDVPSLLSRASCLLLTSDYEGCPYSILEAMAAAVPVVATSVGGVPEFVDERSGVLVEPGRPDALADALSDLLRSPEQARELGVAGRERVKREFTLRAMTEAVSMLYDEVAAESRRRSA
jgi:glycosyltransferase involved in cell wall biosynthesis